MPQEFDNSWGRNEYKKRNADSTGVYNSNTNKNKQLSFLDSKHNVNNNKGLSEMIPNI